MKLIDKFEPKLPKSITARQLHSTYFQTRKIPYIEMRLLDDAVEATVEFEFFYNKVNTKKRVRAATVGEFEIVKRIITGPSDLVYATAAKQASRISLSLSKQFNDEWQRALMNLLNKPSKNKTVLNLGLYKNNNYGIYDIEEPKTLLARLMSENDIKQKDLAFNAGVDETTLWRHLKGTAEISRDAAIKYAKILGCDPAEILFNDLTVPIWGTTDTFSGYTIDRVSVGHSEIVAKKDLGVIKCPREIYRPDIKAIKIDSPHSHYHGQVAFYYNSNEPINLNGQIVVVGVNLKNRNDNKVRARYFIGVYDGIGKKIDLKSIDPNVYDIRGFEPDEDLQYFTDAQIFIEDNSLVETQFEPFFVAPVVAFINPSEIYSPLKTDIQKAYNEIYTQSRNQEAEAIKQFKSNQITSALEDKLGLLEDETDLDDYEIMEQRKLQALMEADKKLQSVISVAAYGKAKYEKKINIKEQVKKIKADLTAKEEAIIADAHDRITDVMENSVSPTDEDYAATNEN